MAHPYHAHRQHKVEHSRVGHITRGYASGGAVSLDEKQDRKLLKKLMREEDSQAVEGGEAKERMDRPGRAGKKDGGAINRARGGRTKSKGHTTVNVITVGGHPTAPLAAGGPPGMGPVPMLPPRPPMPPPVMPPGGPGMAPPGMAGLPGMAPGVPPRSSGGRAYAKGGRVRKRADGGSADDAWETPMTGQEQMDASQRRIAAGKTFGERWKAAPPLSVLGQALREQGKVRKPIAKPGEQRRWDESLEPTTIKRARGGAVKDGPTWDEGRKAGTPVQNNPSGKNDQRDVGRGKPVTYNTGGGVQAPPGTPHLPGGSGGGLARLAKKKMVHGGMAP